MNEFYITSSCDEKDSHENGTVESINSYTPPTYNPPVYINETSEVSPPPCDGTVKNLHSAETVMENVEREAREFSRKVTACAFSEVLYEIPAAFIEEKIKTAVVDSVLNILLQTTALEKSEALLHTENSVNNVNNENNINDENNVPEVGADVVKNDNNAGSPFTL